MYLITLPKQEVSTLNKIDRKVVQQYIDHHQNKEIYLHLETTNGAYATHHEKKFASGAFIRNAEISYTHGKITGSGPYRVGLETAFGWVYAEGLTHFVLDEQNRLLLTGIGYDGKLAVTLEISEAPFLK